MAAMSPRPARLLIADDNLQIREMLKEIMAMHGYEVDTAEDGEAALARAGERDFDLFIIDRRMPRMDGGELLRRLRESAGGKRRPVIMMSSENVDAVSGSYVPGFIEWVTKPISPELLVEKVAEHLSAARKRG